MDIQNLLLSGYSLSDIKELLALFIANVNEAKKVLIRNDDEQIKLTIHKLKGGLIILKFNDLLNACCSIEEKIKTYGIKPNKNLVHYLLDICASESINASKDLEILISDNDINL